jgi:hypothetical protein
MKLTIYGDDPKPRVEKHLKLVPAGENVSVVVINSDGEVAYMGYLITIKANGDILVHNSNSHGFLFKETIG